MHLSSASMYKNIRLIGTVCTQDGLAQLTRLIKFSPFEEKQFWITQRQV